MSAWFLEGYFGNEGTMRKLALREFPQVVGRDQNLECSIISPGVSRQHAKLEEVEGDLCISDLRSSNGTYVNHERIEALTKVTHGDVIHFGGLELRLIDQNHSQAVESVGKETSSETVFLSQAQLSETFPAGVRELEELIANRAVEPAFQPILKADGQTVCGFEALGRGASPKLSQSPLALFNIAESVDLEIALSDLMRNVAVDTAASYKLKGDIWVNTHPKEMIDLDVMLRSLTQLRKRHPNLALVFEVHEQCVTDRDSLRDFKAQLRKMNIKFAFDDFGVGQSRLTELVEAKPDIIKFDKVLIEGIDHSDNGRVRLLQHLKDMASELGILTLAECVENAGEYGVCDQLGFDLYQGYHFAKPQPAKNFVS